MLSLQQRCILFLIRSPALINFKVLSRDLIDEILMAIRDPYYGSPRIAVREVVCSENNLLDFIECLFLHQPNHPLLEYIDVTHHGYARYISVSHQRIWKTKRGTSYVYADVIYDPNQNMFISINEEIGNTCKIVLKRTEITLCISPKLDVGCEPTDYTLFREEFFSPEFLIIAEQEGVLSPQYLIPPQYLK